MARKSITLITGAAVLICLTGVYVLLGNYNKKTEEAAADAASGETILEIDTEGLVSASFSIGGEEQTFIKDDTEWELEGDDTFPVDSSSLLSCLSGISPLKAQRTLTGISDLSEYGLDDPQNTITLENSEGDKTIITIGDANANTSDDYLMLNGDASTVYTVENTSFSSLSQDLYDYALSDGLPLLQTDTITGIRVSDSDNDYELSRIGGTWMAEDSLGQTETADEDQVTTLLAQLTALSYVDYLEHNCTDLSPYGLDDPAALLTISWEGDADSSEESSGSITFSVGSTDANGNYYVQLEGSGQVHTLAASLVETFLNCSVDELWETESETESEMESEMESEAESETE